jgi:hypothetical protein
VAPPRREAPGPRNRRAALGAALFLLARGIAGAAAVPYLAYVELAALGAVCVYCTAMHALIAAILALAIVIARGLSVPRYARAAARHGGEGLQNAGAALRHN